MAHKGTVKWFNNHKGFGFLGREIGQDVFVHYSGIEATGFRVLNEGEEVEFDVAADDRGREMAVNVRRLKYQPVRS